VISHEVARSASRFLSGGDQPHVLPLVKSTPMIHSAHPSHLSSQPSVPFRSTIEQHQKMNENPRAPHSNPPHAGASRENPVSTPPAVREIPRIEVTPPSPRPSHRASETSASGSGSATEQGGRTSRSFGKRKAPGNSTTQEGAGSKGLLHPGDAMVKRRVGSTSTTALSV
jgi:hypothetical protein